MYCYRIQPINYDEKFSLQPSESVELSFDLPKDLLITKYIPLGIDSYTKLNLGVEWNVRYLDPEHSLIDSDFFLMTENFKTLNFMKRYLYNAGRCELMVVIENRSPKKITLQNISLIVHSTWNKDLKHQIKQVTDNRKLSYLYFNMENGGIDFNLSAKVEKFY